MPPFEWKRRPPLTRVTSCALAVHKYKLIGHAALMRPLAVHYIGNIVTKKFIESVINSPAAGSDTIFGSVWLLRSIKSPCEY